jgi:hypothetical protein
MKSVAQLRFYRAIWAQICEAQGWAHLPEVEKDAKRRALHIELRLPHSSTQFANHHFTKWDTATRKLRKETATPRPSAPDTQRDQAIWRIREDAKLANLSEHYLNKISFDRFSTLLWEDLTGADLQKFRNLIHHRAGKILGHDTRTAPAGRDAAPSASVESENEPF